MTRLIPPALALAFALSCSAVWGEATDWAIEPGDSVYGPICATDKASCDEALRAMSKRWVFRDLNTSLAQQQHCVPAPGCRPARDLCIPGYSGSRPEGYCR
jgi:hypothetical protein